MKLYAHPDKHLTKKILIAAAYAQLDIEVPKASGGAEEGRIPVLETDKGCIFSANAIARYVSRMRRDVGLYGQTLLESGAIDSWMEFCTHELEVPLLAWTQQASIPAAVVEKAKGDVQKALTVLDNHLLRFTFVAGDQVTLADISFCAILAHGVRLLTPAFMSSFGNLRRWFTTCMAQPEFSKILGKVEGGSGASASKGSPKAAPKKEAAKKEGSPKAAAKKAEAPKMEAASGGAVDEAAIKAVGDDIRVLKEKLKAEGITGKKMNENAEVAALVAKLSELKKGGAAPAAAASPKAKGKADAPAKKAKEAKGEQGEQEEKPKTQEELEADRKKQIKVAIKEGGKRGVEIEGAADMGGLQFFCTSVDAPQGDVELLTKCLDAMNEKSDPTEEERKGGSGAIGKMIFSAGTDQLALAAYVPDAPLKDLQGNPATLVTEDWLKAVLALFGGTVVSTSKTVCIGTVKADGDKNIFPLKIREPMILEANNFLRKKNLFPEDNGSDDDEMVFGDDDFPS